MLSEYSVSRPLGTVELHVSPLIRTVTSLYGHEKTSTYIEEGVHQ